MKQQASPAAPHRELDVGDQEINFHQLANGPPFGDHTERALGALRGA